MVTKHEKYLGLPTLVGKLKKKKIFMTIIDRVVNKLKGWKEKSLSNANKEVLIKVVA